MKYEEKAIRFEYGPYVVAKDNEKWYWVHKSSTCEFDGWCDTPLECFKDIDKREENSAKQAAAQHASERKGPTLPEREYYATEEPVKGTMAFHRPAEPYNIQDMMLKLNSMIVEQKNPTDIYHYISSILSRIIWQSNIK